MAENSSGAIQEVKKALQELLGVLDQDLVEKAIAAIPDSIMGPVIEGLKAVLGVVKDALNELKAKLGDALNITAIVEPVNSLLGAAASLAPSQGDTINEVGSIVNDVLANLPTVQEIEAVITLADQVVAKLEAL